MTGPARFRFLNVEAEIGNSSQWNSPDRSALWLYNAHYFDDLNANGAEMRSTWHLQLINRWIRENSLGHGVGWDPYPTSLRIVNWIKWDLVTGMLSVDARASLAQQVRWLQGRLEYHLLGNHLLANLKALVFAGLYFAGREADVWYTDAIRRLTGQIGEQVLADGGHFERSPMYHAIVLEDVLDIVNIHRAYGVGVPTTILATATKMLSWLEVMTHPDGEIAFFNDSALGIAANSDALRDYALRLDVPVSERSSGRLVYLQDSGYVRTSAGAATAFLDLAPIGPDYLPGHAHADTLSFELSIGDQRILVNSGTSTYQAGSLRDLQRGTTSHNTVVVDGEDSSEVWGAFRVARRARVFNARVKEDGNQVFITAAHDGYRRLPGHVIHRRTWKVGDCGMVIEDTIDGGGLHEVTARLHLHPACRATPTASGAVIMTEAGHEVVVTCLTEDVSVSLENDLYWPEFGLEHMTQTLVVSSTRELPVHMVTLLSWCPSTRGNR